MNTDNYNDGLGTELPAMMDSIREIRASIPEDASPTYRKLMLGLTDFGCEMMDFASKLWQTQQKRNPPTANTEKSTAQATVSLRSETPSSMTEAESPGYCPRNGVRNSLDYQEAVRDDFRKDDPGSSYDVYRKSPMTSLRSETLNIANASRCNIGSVLLERTYQDMEANPKAWEGNARTGKSGCSGDVHRNEGNLGRRRIKIGSDVPNVAAGAVGFQRGRRACYKQNDIATNGGLGVQRGRRASNKNKNCPSKEILLFPNNIKTTSGGNVEEWENWFGQFISEACGWSDHKKQLIARNPEMMPEAVAQMNMVKPDENVAAGKLTQPFKGIHWGASSHLAWGCANRHIKSSELDKEQRAGHQNWWRRSPTTLRKDAGTCKFGECDQARPLWNECAMDVLCNSRGSSPRNIDGGSSYKYKHGCYSPGRGHKEYQGHCSRQRSNPLTGNMTDSALDRKFPSSEPLERPESILSPSWRSAGLPIPLETRGKHPSSWKRGERRMLY